jgi:alginate O-acetyltransferase complex protein AlgI
LPGRWRLGFLALVSGSYIFALSPFNALVLLAWTLLFYAVAPLSCRRAPVNVRRSSAREPALAAVGDGDGTAISPVPRTSKAAERPAPPARDRRWVMWLLVCGILGYLACFKYIVPYTVGRGTGGGAGRYLIPLGVSYFTFKFIHYAVESARGSVTDRSLISFLCYIFLFPTFSAGPIERYDHFLDNQECRWEARMLVEGLTRIIRGLVKKLVLGEILLGSIFRTDLFGFGVKPLREVTTLSLWGTAIVSYLFVYLDFSGYSDVAIGASRLFGLHIMENFAFPFLAPNVAEFWKR